MTDQANRWHWVEFDHIELTAPDMELPLVFRLVQAHQDKKELTFEIHEPKEAPAYGYYQLEIVPRPNNHNAPTPRYVVKLVGFNFPSHSTVELVFEDMGYV